MVIALIGESCTGKSSIAQMLKNKTNAEVIAGKDYLRMAKSQNEAEKIFIDYLVQKQDGIDMVVFVISEMDLIRFLPAKAVRLYCGAPLNVIKERFAGRMHGNLPEPVAMMLENKHGIFDQGEYSLKFDTTESDIETICEEILTYCRSL